MSKEASLPESVDEPSAPGSPAVEPAEASPEDGSDDPGPDVDDPDCDELEPVEPAEPVGSANATPGIDAIAAPTPNATASAPTRPT